MARAKPLRTEAFSRTSPSQSASTKRSISELEIFLADALSFRFHIKFGEYPKSVSTKERLA